MPLCNKTIKTKLSLFLMASSTMAVLLVCMMFYFLVARHFQVNYQKDLQNLAVIVGHNCMAALVFNVPEDAETVLSSLESRKSILSVRLYDNSHKLFAAYTNTRNSQFTSPQGYDSDPERTLTIEQPITMSDGTVVGTIVVHDDIRAIAISKQKGISFLAVASLIALFATFLLATVLQAILSRPLLALTAAVQRLAAGDFAARNEIRVQGQDEVGMLSAAFVDMSQKLEDSHIKLEAYSHSLEKRVTDRTVELQKALDDLTKSQEQLIQSEKMVALGHLIAGVAHEINNNINFIAGAIPSIARLTKELAQHCCGVGDRPDREQIKEIVRKIEGLLNNAHIGVHRTAKIVLDLNRFARPSHGRLTKTNIHQEIEMVLTLLRYELQDRIEVYLEFAPALPPLFCHQDQMNQVYMNILRNAIQAINGKGSIHIRTWLSDGLINISFQDSGGGIPPSARTNIFDPFFTTKPVGEGTGLGLSISYGIVKNHQGEIFVESTGKDGTTFVLRLPLDPAAAAAGGETMLLTNTDGGPVPGVVAAGAK